MPSNTPETQALLPVTQLAREAVAKQVEEAFYDECEYAQELRQGMHDSDPNLQHFARFERDILARQSSNAAERGAVDERALRWIKHNLRVAEQMMKASADEGNGYANFAAHDAHHALSVALASLSTPTAEPISEPTRRMEQTLGAKFVPTPDRIGKDAVREALEDTMSTSAVKAEAIVDGGGTCLWIAEKLNQQMIDNRATLDADRPQNKGEVNRG